MDKRFLVLAALLLLGAGCFGGNGDGTDNANAGTLENSGTELCVRTDGDATGDIRLYAANLTTGAREQWFTETPVGVDDAADEVCGNLAFPVAVGEKVQINGSWFDGTEDRWLVQNRTPDASGSDNVKEIWIDNQYYAVGKECQYESNGMMGFDIVCTLR